MIIFLSSFPPFFYRNCGKMGPHSLHLEYFEFIETE